MSARKDDIEFLENFRNKVDEYLFLGYAPPNHPGAHEYDAKALLMIDKAMNDRNFRNLRRSVNGMLPRAKRLLAECKATPTLVQSPPPIVGGPVLSFNGLDLLMENSSEFRLKKSVILDAIDRAAGTLKEMPRNIAQEKEKKTGPDQPYLFISHSSKDATIVSAVKQALEDLPLKPRFVEDKPSGLAPSKAIAQAVMDAEALFVFFTYNSISGDTRDWIAFEIGVAIGYDKPIYSWKQRPLLKEQLPRLLEQVSTYREFEISGDGIIRLSGEIRAAAKNHC